VLTFIVVSLIFAAGSFVQTIAGFGSALVIMPLLTYYIGIQSAATVMALVGGAVIATVLYQNWGGLRWGDALLLLSGSVIGIPLGTYALKVLPSAPVIALLGVMLLAYGSYSLLAGTPAAGVAVIAGAERWSLRRVAAAWAVGLSAGCLGGAYATDGPPLVIYGSVKRWPKDAFRSILQACFLVDGILIIVCHGAGGLMSRDVFTYSLYGIPGMVAGLLAGSLLDKRINHALFQRILLAAITFLGGALLARAYFAA